MGFLAGKRLVITGLLSNRSIAYGVARACRREGASLAFTYVSDELKDRVAKLAADFGPAPLLRCDVTKDDDIASCVPMFDCYAGKVVNVGGLGAAQAVKLINNAFMTAITGLVFDSFDLGAKFGVRPGRPR